MKDEFEGATPISQGQGEPSSAENEEYAVGYGKPPKHTQFPYGNGPGKGKPKGAKNMKTIVNLATAVKVTTKINGKVKKISKLELSVHQLANKAAGGDLKAIEKLIALQERYGPEEQSVEPTAEDTKADFETLKNYLALHQLSDAVNEDQNGDDQA